MTGCVSCAMHAVGARERCQTEQDAKCKAEETGHYAPLLAARQGLMQALARWLDASAQRVAKSSHITRAASTLLRHITRQRHAFKSIVISASGNQDRLFCSSHNKTAKRHPSIADDHKGGAVNRSIHLPLQSVSPHNRPRNSAPADLASGITFSLPKYARCCTVIGHEAGER